MSRSRNTQRYRDAKAFRYVSGVRPPILSRVLLYGHGCPDCGSGRCDWCESNDRRRNIRRAYESVRALLADALDPSCSCEGCSSAGECPGCGELRCECETDFGSYSSNSASGRDDTPNGQGPEH